MGVCYAFKRGFFIRREQDCHVVFLIRERLKGFEEVFLVFQKIDHVHEIFLRIYVEKCVRIRMFRHLYEEGGVPLCGQTCDVARNQRLSCAAFRGKESDDLFEL